MGDNLQDHSLQHTSQNFERRTMDDVHIQVIREFPARFKEVFSAILQKLPLAEINRRFDLLHQYHVHLQQIYDEKKGEVVKSIAEIAELVRERKELRDSNEALCAEVARLSASEGTRAVLEPGQALHAELLLERESHARTKRQVTELLVMLAESHDFSDKFNKRSRTVMDRIAETVGSKLVRDEDAEIVGIK